MQFMGGKAKIARRITEVMLAAQGDRTHYLEPFLGGCNVLPLMAPHFATATAADLGVDLAMMWQAAIVDEWEPPTTLTRAEYAALREAPPSPLRAFAGYGCSFGGGWFEGYATNTRGDDFAGAARRGILRKARAVRAAEARVEIVNVAYDAHRPDSEALVYCDPPYAGTKSYGGLPPWDAEAFWATVRGWADQGALTFVSEYAAPEDFVPVWEREQRGSINKSTNTHAVVERLWVHESQAEQVGSDR